MSFKMKFEALQPIGYGDYESGLAEGRKQGIEQGKVLGLQQGVSQTNADVLVLTGTEKPTATQAIEEINATLATNLTAKGVEADATETTDELAEKVGGIKDPQASYDEGYNVGFAEGKAIGDYVSNATTITFSNVSADDATALRHYPNLNIPRAATLRKCFEENHAVETIGDIFAPNALEVSRMFQNATNITEVGKITYTQGYASGAFFNCTKLVKIGGIVGFITSAYELFKGCIALEEITEPLDFSKMENAYEHKNAFSGCANLRWLRFVIGSIRYNLGLNDCTKLSAESWESIINGLADLTGQTACTLTVPKSAEVPLTETQRATATAKNWTIAEA